MTCIRIRLGELTITAKLNDSDTARLLREALPFESTAKRWGDEVYFETPLATTEENAQAEVPSGTVAYWPPGKALCLFFGQKPYSPVVVIGHIEGNPEELAAVTDGENVQVQNA